MLDRATWFSRKERSARSYGSVKAQLSGRQVYTEGDERSLQIRVRRGSSLWYLAIARHLNGHWDVSSSIKGPTKVKFKDHSLEGR